MKRLVDRVWAIEVIAFVSGLTLMSFELVAARLLAPTIGSSMYIWTSVIGVVAALSFGYYAGGKLADARGHGFDIVWVLLAAAGLIGLTGFIYPGVLEWVSKNFVDPRLQGLVASLVLFAPVSFCLGILSPYLAKARILDLATSGQSVASLSALNSVGGIVGTFVTGFVLFGYFGSREALGALVFLLVISSCLMFPKKKLGTRLLVGLMALLLATSPARTAGALTVDTPSAHYEVLRGVTPSGQRLRYLISGPEGAQSGVDEDRPDALLFWYTSEMARLVAELPKKDRILMLGGGAYSLPEYLGRTYPESTVDVVEIDPGLAELAREQFFYERPVNVNEITADARSFVNQTNNVYDIVLVDVYSDAMVPFSLLTREFGRQAKRITRPGGAVIVNVIAGLEADCMPLAQAFGAPYREQFDNAYFRSTPETPGDELRQNMVFVFTDGPAPRGLQSFPADKQAPLYTDNFMPVERLANACQD